MEIHILLVEDNEGDIVLTKEAFSCGKINNRITVARDGEASLNMLANPDNYKGYERPALLLLAINLPKIDGIEVCP